MNSQPDGLQLIEELKKKDVDMQWILSMLYFVCPQHYVFDKNFGLNSQSKPQVVENIPADDKYNVYRDAFVGRLPPK